MKRGIPVLILLVGFLFYTPIEAQLKLKGNKIVINQDRGLSDFTAIEVSDNIDVFLTQGNSQSVSVEADENLMDAISTEVNNGILKLRLTQRIVRKKALLIHIVFNDELEEITGKDKADIRSKSTINLPTLTVNGLGDSKMILDVKTSNFTLNNNESANLNLTVQAEDANMSANKSGKTKMTLTADNLDLTAQGNSNTEIVGTLNELTINAENKSNIKAATLECDDILVYASDGADVSINATNSLTISAINSAEIYIYNNPKITLEKFSDKAILRKK